VWVDDRDENSGRRWGGIAGGSCCSIAVLVGFGTILSTGQTKFAHQAGQTLVHDWAVATRRRRHNDGARSRDRRFDYHGGLVVVMVVGGGGRTRGYYQHRKGQGVAIVGGNDAEASRRLVLLASSLAAARWWVPAFLLDWQLLWLVRMISTMVVVVAKSIAFVVVADRHFDGTRCALWWAKI
jgi:hypothetical protein